MGSPSERAKWFPPVASVPLSVERIWTDGQAAERAETLTPALSQRERESPQASHSEGESVKVPSSSTWRAPRGVSVPLRGFIPGRRSSSVRPFTL